MSPENTVGHLIKAVLEVFEKERRRPLLNENHPSCFELHYSPFSLQNIYSCQIKIQKGEFYVSRRRSIKFQSTESDADT
ncbi:hypothetical protein SOVF_107890 [Spinacia oleracea]|nr:hypothetical protein SOVF_107890 [Spinacia oleracea]